VTEKTLPLLALTAGELAGIGPDLCVQIAQEGFLYPVVVIADPDVLQQRAALLGLPLNIIEGLPKKGADDRKKQCLYVLPVASRVPVEPGKLDARNAEYVLETLKVAATGCMEGRFSAMVTAPVHKGIINDAGITFSGHTEYLQALCNVKRVVMMLATQGLRVALVTTHLPLSQVASAITQERLRDVITILLVDLAHRFGLTKPRILVAGLNPHAGEGGHLGHEEQEVISPVLDAFRSQGVDLIGPLPADTLFTPHHLHHADAVLAMYHDQGLPVLKYKGFGAAVNITLGLPIIRTSVDHGTALDIVGEGVANTGSLHIALDTAASMAGYQGMDSSVTDFHQKDSFLYE